MSRSSGPRRLSSFLPIAKDPETIYNAYPPFVNGASKKTLIISPTQSPTLNGRLPPPSLVVDERFDENQLDGAPVCRVVTRADSKLTAPADLNISNSSVLSRLDSIYHAMAHENTRQLQYMQKHASAAHDDDEEAKLVSLTRSSLEDAGFQRLSRRDIDLCDALNAGYLLRLSLLPDTKNLDPNLFQKFYPELVGENKKLLNDDDELLFDGRVLVYWRGYSEEVSQGRLTLPKLDYLQASIVQRSAAWLKQRLNVAERWIVMQVAERYQRAVQEIRSLVWSAIGKLPNGPVVYSIRLKLDSNSLKKTPSIGTLSNRGKLFTLSRYGGSKMRFVGSPDPTNALNPFVVCKEGCSETDLSVNMTIGKAKSDQAEEELYQLIKRGDLKCLYDDDEDDTKQNVIIGKTSMQLLKRVSLGSLIDLFTRDGRGKLLRTLIAKSKLVEPTYKEVVVIWRPLPKKDTRFPVVNIPLWVYDVADMFDIEGLPPKPQKPTAPMPNQLEIRAFSDVPMANLPAVLPKTKLVFRPADAFVFDSITLLSLILVVSSFKFDNPRLDLLALVSGVLWTIRTFFRYSNKLARYDLLVKTFLTSKITHRNMGALKYIATEAGSQRALRASLFHTLLSRIYNGGEMEPTEREDLLKQSQVVLDSEFQEAAHHAVDLDAAFSDLEDLRLIRSTRDGRYVVVRDSSSVLAALKKSWCDLFGS